MEILLSETPKVRSKDIVLFEGKIIKRLIGKVWETRRKENIKLYKKTTEKEHQAIQKSLQERAYQAIQKDNREENIK